MVCTVAYITWLLGYMPPPGTVITVPQAYVAQYNDQMQGKAIRCAARYKILLTKGARVNEQ